LQARAGGEYSAAPSHWTKGQLPVSRKDNFRHRELAVISVPTTEELAMRPKTQALARVRTADELKNTRTTQIFGLAMTAVFVAMLLLNAISY
jgi:hypothetical protein